MSATDTNPSVLFPGTTWTQLKDRFLLGAGDTYTNGTTAGSATISYTPAGSVGNHTLTEAEMPAHTHTFTGTQTWSSGVDQWHYHSVPSLSGYTSTSEVNIRIGSWDGGSPGYMNLQSSAMSHGSASGSDVIMACSGHSHTVATYESWTGTDSVNHKHYHTPEGTNSTTGSGTAHNHGFTGTQATLSTMSPYLVVYIWKRTA